MILRLVACVLFSLYNTYTDIKSYRIRNASVLTFSLLALVRAVVSESTGELGSALCGGAVMLVLFPLFALRMLGAGDVKALIAIGLMLGFPMAVWALLYSILCNGVIALVLLFLRGNGRNRLKTLGAYLKSSLLFATPLPYSSGGRDSGSYRFSFGITAGMLALLIREYLGG